MESIITIAIVTLLLTAAVINILTFCEILIRITDEDYGVKDTFKKYLELWEDKNALGKIYILIFSIITIPSVIFAFIIFIIIVVCMMLWGLGENKGKRYNMYNREEKVNEK